MSRASCLRAASAAPAGRTLASSRDAAVAVRSVGAPPGTRSRSSACSWLIRRVRWVIRLLRRSSSNARTAVRSSPATGFASPASAATLAAAAASMTSFLRRPPRESSRTRAVAVEGTSRTTSPRATSHCAKCRPRPRAFSTAQRRDSNLAAHFSSRRYPASDASTCNVAATWFVPGSTALAVWVRLWGSTAMITTGVETFRPTALKRETADDTPTSSSG